MSKYRHDFVPEASASQSGEIDGGFGAVAANILVADDDDLLGELLSFKLEEAGLSVEVVTDGESAVRRAQSGEFDLLVLDAMMPVLSGFQVLQKLRREPGASNLPIIMLTARNSKEDVVSALKAGATDYITKPFIPDELVIRIETIIAGKKDDATGPN